MHMRLGARLAAAVALIFGLVAGAGIPATTASASATPPAAVVAQVETMLAERAAYAMGNEDEPVVPYIVGGSNATQQYGSVSIQNPSDAHRCTGVLIDPRWVITAWHCEFILVPGETEIRVGSLSRSSGGELVGITQVILHPDHPTTPRGGGDLALLRLDRKVNAQPVPLAVQSGPPGTPTRIAGWGVICQDETDPTCGELPDHLQQTDTQLLADSECSLVFEGLETFNGPAELCSVGANGRYTMACYGDSGGAQLRWLWGKWRLIGTTSRDADDVMHRTNDCSTAPDNTPGKGVWEDVTYPGHLAWIMETLWTHDRPAFWRTARLAAS